MGWSMGTWKNVAQASPLAASVEMPRRVGTRGLLAEPLAVVRTTAATLALPCKGRIGNLLRGIMLA